MPAAFVLGAGLGTRLRPLTHRIPKPLLPVAHRPLLEWAFAHLRAELGVDRLVVNTHHLPQAFVAAYPDGGWDGLPLAFRHEPVLLDTGGGLANVRDLLPADEPVVVYNGDILSDAPLAGAWRHHLASGAEATLVLRRDGPITNVTCAMEAGAGGQAVGRVLDLRGLRGAAGPRFQFTGICFVSPAGLAALPAAGEVFSLVPHWLRRIEAGARIDGVVAEEGAWWDLGDAGSVLAAHRWLAGHPYPRWRPGWQPRIHPGAEVAEGTLDAWSWAGPGVVVPSGCRVESSVLLAGARLDPGLSLAGCLVAPGRHVSAPESGPILA